ncbi:hypothetical protein [Thermocatellispora tengchongensis]
MRLNQWTSVALFLGAMTYFYLARNKKSEEPLGDERVPAEAK